MDAFARARDRSALVLICCVLMLCQVAARAQQVEQRGSLELYFTPEDDAAKAVVATILQARQSVLVQAFSFTHDRIARALAQTHRRGVNVAVILDQGQYEKGFTPVARELLGAGIPVFLDRGHAAAHNKIIIIDAASPAAVVITGSFNFTRAAQHRNAENLLLFRGNTTLAQRYVDNWARHHKHSSALR